MMKNSLTGIEIEDRVATISFNNPPYNIMTFDLRKGLLRKLIDIGNDKNISVVVFESRAEKAFSTGFDIKEFPDDEAGGLSMIRFAQHVLDVIYNLPQVTVIKLHGHVLGGGACLMLVCDFRLASEDAKFGMPEIKVGAFSAGGGTHMLARQIGVLRARELILLGDSIDAHEAARIGLINRVVERQDLDAETASLVKRLTELSRPALREAKKAVNTSLTEPFQVGQTTEAAGMARLFCEPDIHEGVAAFLSKRKPIFDA